MKNKHTVAAALMSVFLVTGCETVQEADNLAVLGVDFDWSDTPACSSRSPAFNITNVPAGTAALRFKMTDLDVRTFNHGGGTVDYTGSGAIPAGSFSYTGPCPPSGSHDYEFEVTALNATGDVILGRGTAVRAFPPE